MSQKKIDQNSLADFKINVKIELAILWTTLMFLYIYADYFNLMTPGKLEKMMNLQTPIGPTTPGLLIIFSVLLIIPALMIFTSILLKPLINKWLNIIFGLLYAIISVLIIISDIDSKWQGFFVLYNIIEFFVLARIIWKAWNWPKIENITKADNNV